MAEFVVFAFGVLSSNKLVLCGTEFESGVGCLVHKWHASTASKSSLGAWGPREGKKGSRATQVGLSFAQQMVNWSAMSLKMGNQRES